MSRPLEIVTQVERGALPAAHYRLLRTAFTNMEGRRLRITVQEIKKRRSNPQNRLWHGPIVNHAIALFREHGTVLSHEAAHAFLKEHVLGLTDIVVTPEGKRVPVVGSMKHLSTAEFSEKCDMAMAWLAEHGRPVLDAREYL